MRLKLFVRGLLLSTMLAVTMPAVGGEWSGYIAAEARLYPNAARYAEQNRHDVSLMAEAEYFHEWNNGHDILGFKGFVRADNSDARRTHVDIRELAWIHAAEDWELRVGLRKVFWGVTESIHLVDIINQTDAVENMDGEDKLGQPMLNLALIRDWGTLDLFLMPWFRERAWPGQQGRLRTEPPVDLDRPIYQSSRKQHHPDWAIRWSHSIGDWDIGLSHFHGTQRDAELQPIADRFGRLRLRPYYPILDQTGLDLQATKEDWLWKLEVASRKGSGDRYTALAGGFEYTLYGIQDSAADLGLLLEYLFDDRGRQASTPFQDDIFLGMRLTLNDVQSTELLAGVIADRRSSARMYSIEASRRLGDNWKLTLEGRFMSNIQVYDPMFALRDDDHVLLELAWYF